MRLSTSNSNERLPKGNWFTTWTIVGLLFITFIFITEYHIRNKGFKPSVVDSVQLWSTQRYNASSLGENAIILVGASRIQLDIDLDSLREFSRLTPVQLAIDGTSYIPVLEHLANDSSIVGTIIVSVNAYNIGKGKPEHKSSQWVKHYNLNKNNKIEPYKKINNSIKAYFNNTLVTRLEGAKPSKVISSLFFIQNSYGNYLTTEKNRSRSGDYSKVQMPHFYANRVQRHCGQRKFDKKISTFNDFFTLYQNYISTIKPSGAKNFFPNLDYLLLLTKKIEERGGNVIFVRFPTDRLPWDFDNAKYPKNIFWDEIEKRHYKSIHFKDYPEMSKFYLKDGSHLDFRDKKEFTKGLMSVISQKQLIKI